MVSLDPEPRTLWQASRKLASDALKSSVVAEAVAILDGSEQETRIVSGGDDQAQHQALATQEQQ